MQEPKGLSVLDLISSSLCDLITIATHFDLSQCKRSVEISDPWSDSLRTTCRRCAKRYPRRLCDLRIERAKCTSPPCSLHVKPHVPAPISIGRRGMMDRRMDALSSPSACTRMQRRLEDKYSSSLPRARHGDWPVAPLHGRSGSHVPFSALQKDTQRLLTVVDEKLTDFQEDGYIHSSPPFKLLHSTFNWSCTPPQDHHHSLATLHPPCTQQLI